MSGIKSKNSGDFFEGLFARACQSSGCAVTRIPDGCRQVTATRLIRVRSPFDFVVSYNGHTALIDTKTTQEARFASSMIKDHQLQALYAHDHLNAYAGYVIWLRKTDTVLYAPARTLWKHMRAKESINEGSQVVVLGKNVSRLFHLDHFDTKKIFHPAFVE